MDQVLGNQFGIIQYTGTKPRERYFQPRSEGTQKGNSFRSPEKDTGEICSIEVIDFSVGEANSAGRKSVENKLYLTFLPSSTLLHMSPLIEPNWKPENKEGLLIQCILIS